MAIPADPSTDMTRAAPAASRTTPYGPDPAQVYDVRLPTRAPRGTTVAVIHGGFWRAEFDRTHAASQAQAFADNGFHVAVLEYRRVGMNGGGWPGTFEDIMTAVGAVRADPELPDHVVLVGHSAGGHLAALTPAVPLLLLHGADDQVVPPEVSQSYADTVRRSSRAHAEVRRTVIPACDHFGLIDPEHPAFAVVLSAVRSLAP